MAQVCLSKYFTRLTLTWKSNRLCLSVVKNRQLMHVCLSVVFSLLSVVFSLLINHTHTHIYTPSLNPFSFNDRKCLKCAIH